MADNARRRIRAENDAEPPQKKDKTVDKPRYESTPTFTRTATTIAKPAVSTQPATSSPLSNVKDSKEGNCFICYKHGHLARDCPDKETRAAMIKEFQLGTDSDYESHSEN